MRNIARERDPVKCQPPMTPMIDIIFQLLLFFMLMPSWSGDEGYLTTNLPTTQGPNRADQSTVPRIKIGLFDEEPRGEGVTVELNQTQSIGSTVGVQFGTEDDKKRYVRSLFDKLQAALRALKDSGLQADHPVLIAPTPAVQHQYVVGAFDAAVGARFTNIQFAVPGYLASGTKPE
jgi:biopolymer transport protein ExbD